jgi:hypothetical protein
VNCQELIEAARHSDQVTNAVVGAIVCCVFAATALCTHFFKGTPGTANAQTTSSEPSPEVKEDA